MTSSVDEVSNNVRYAPSLFECFIAWAGLTIVLLTGCKLSTPDSLSIYIVTGVGLISLGVICILRAAIPWGETPE